MIYGHWTTQPSMDKDYTAIYRKLNHLWTRTSQPFTENSTIYGQRQHIHLLKTQPSMDNDNTFIYRKLNHLWTTQPLQKTQPSMNTTII